MKLLIADDDLTSRTMLAAVSKKWGYEPVVAEDGEAAWEILQQPEAPGLLLIDWEMPRLDGLGLCNRIRESTNENPPFIILLTSKSETGDVVAGLEAGANDYIVKPFANAELQARLNAGQRMLEMQGELQKARDEMTNEREIIENIILKMRFSKPFEGKDLRILDVPVEKTSGDILLSCSKADKTRHFMLGDFTGHGLTAAIGGPVVYDIFYTMTAKNIPLVEIAQEVNKQLLAKLPTSLFLGAIFIEFNPDDYTLSIWNCGMSDMLIYRDSQLKQKIASSLFALGVIKQEFEPTLVLTVEKDDRIYSFSDGITEVINSENEEFGDARLEQTIIEMLSNKEDLEFLTRTVDGFRGNVGQFDDITLLELTC